jgi:antitoxin StbD
MQAIYAQSSVGISQLKSNPNNVLALAGDSPVAVLNRNKPIAYFLSAPAWEKIYEQLEDIDLREAAIARLSDGQVPIKVSLDAL